MTILANILDADTLVPLGTVFAALLIVAGICWRMASVKAEYAADLRYLKQEVATTNREMGKLWGANTQLIDRVARIEGILNGGKE